MAYSEKNAKIVLKNLGKETFIYDASLKDGLGRPFRNPDYVNYMRLEKDNNQKYFLRTWHRFSKNAPKKGCS